MEGPKYTLVPEDYLDLWKQFEEDANKAKDRLWTITSWLYALMSGLMAFLLDQQNHNKILIPFGAGTGILLSLYTWYMSKELGRHIKKHWDRANKIREEKITGLTEVWDLKPPDDSNGSKK